MTEVKIEKYGKKYILVIVGFKRGFLSEDETCAEFSLTKKDIEKLQKGIELRNQEQP